MQATSRSSFKNMVSLADVCSCVRRLHPDLRSRVSPDTLIKYKAVVDEFVTYLQQRFDLVMEQPEDLDLLLLEFRTEAELSKSKHNLLVAAVEFFLPHVKGKLIYSREALKGRANVEAVHRTIPLPEDCAFLLATLHASRGLPRLATAVLLQQGTGLRPSELLGIRCNHVYVPDRLSDVQRVSIRLGVEVSTKVKREQYVLLDLHEQPVVFKLLEWLVGVTSPEDRLFPFSYSFYNNSFKLAEQHFRLQVGWTAHSGRAGFATDRVARGVPAAEVQALGRWLSDSSFRCYIDVVGSLSIQAKVSAQGLANTALWCKANALRYFEPWVHDKEEQSRFNRQTHAARPPKEGESVFDSTSARRPLIVRQTQVARRSAAETHGACNYSSNDVHPTASEQLESRTVSKGKGKGRGRLMVRSKKGSIFS